MLMVFKAKRNQKMHGNVGILLLAQLLKRDSIMAAHFSIGELNN
jgi:hypothetical protein